MRKTVKYEDSMEFPEEDESNLELQAAYEKGLLKPGLIAEVEKKKFPAINNKEGIINKLREFQLNLPWLETLDLTCEPAPLAPELALQLEQRKSIDENADAATVSYDDFARETIFYRLGQAAVLEGIPKLHKLNIPTRRPDDYFAEMAKSDSQMHKIREVLKEKENNLLLKQRAREIRAQRKFGKKVQIERTLQKHAEKRELLSKIKKFRKGQTASLDFLDDDVEKTDTNGLMKSKRQIKNDFKGKNSREMKNRKYGFGGGKKRGWKSNTHEDMDGPIDKVGKKNQTKGKKLTNKNKRHGKNRRHQMKRKRN